MECLSCKHIDSPEAFGSPAKCPQCGVYQDKARAHIERMEKAQSPSTAPEPSQMVNIADEREKLRIGMVREAAGKGYSGQVLDAIEKYPGAQPVVVVDMRMSFWSMVVFMVKWVIASIPAFLILAVLWVLFSATLGSFLNMIIPR